MFFNAWRPERMEVMGSRLRSSHAVRSTYDEDTGQQSFMTGHSVRFHPFA